MTSGFISVFDLTTEAGVEAYLVNTPFACRKAETLSGGSANFVFRLHLHRPHEGRAALVLKHARPYIKNMTDIPFSTKRQSFELEAFKRIREWSPSTAFVTVPNVYHHDETEHVIIMDDCGSDSMTLKEFMRKGRCSMETAHRIGKEVGSFIGQLHSWGESNKDVSAFFETNEEAKQMSSWVFYGWLLPTFDLGLPKLKDPDVKLGLEERNALEKIAEESGDAMRKAVGTFVMGDFWPGNLVLSFDEDKNVTQIRILDWEMSKSGLFGCELGQFCAELILLARFDTEICGNTANVIFEDFLRAYTKHITPDLGMCRRAIVHLGTHLVNLTPRIDWGGKETTQQVVKEGLRLVLDGYSAEREWLEKSAIRPLVMSAT